MPAGLDLALAHLRAYEDNAPELFADQLTTDFRYEYLPPFMGAGPMHARRWCALLHGLYRTWRLTVVDASEADGEIVVRAEWRGAGPAQPGLPDVYFYTVMLKFTVSEGRLASCGALYADVAVRAVWIEDKPQTKPSTASGLDLVLAHLRAYEARTPDLFAEQVGEGFCYSHLPPILGTGPAHARRWYDWLHSVYRTWKLAVVDAFEADSDVVIRTEWRATDPVDPDSAPMFIDSCALRYTVKNGKLASCDAVCLDFGEHAMESAA